MGEPAIAQRMLSGASQVNDAQVADCSRLGVFQTTHTIKWDTPVTTGTVVIEAADDVAYAGTWALLQTVTFSGTAPKQDVVKVDGSYPALRHRVTAPVLDGSVTSRIDAST